jgi:tRNA 2-thiouridine synthesizing protein A
MTAARPSLTLDLRGLNCPLPALRTAKALRRMAPGDVLVVECTDPMAAIDVPHCAQENGGALESRSDSEGVMRFRIRRRPA